MTKIYLVATDQTLTVRQNPKVASGNVNTVHVNVEFSTHWDGFGKSAVFFRDEKGAKPYEKVLTAGECVVPPEVLIDDGIIFIGVRGVGSNGVVKASALIKYKIVDGAPEGEGTSVEPTASVYQQLLAAYGKADEAIAKERTERQAEIAVERKRINSLMPISQNKTQKVFKRFEYPEAFEGTYRPVGVFWDGTNFVTDFNKADWMYTGGTTYYVSVGGSYLNDGLSRGAPVQLYQAITRANDGDTIIITEGIYSIGDLPLSEYNLAKNVNIIGEGTVILAPGSRIWSDFVHDESTGLWSATHPLPIKVLNLDNFG